ncbi:MAG: hypothetical protein J7L46_06800 [Bacteroidales bacterium]|nr:hypothetical protein [Bacteroidales bacterium]
MVIFFMGVSANIKQIFEKGYENNKKWHFSCEGKTLIFSIMMGIKIFVSLTLMLFSLVTGQNSKHLIYWHIRNTVTWSDFRSISKLPGNEAARISTGIKYSVKLEDKNLTFVVQSFANPKDSYYIKKDKSPELLKHEQGHFDICEIFARKFRKQLQTTTFNQNSAGSGTEKIYKQILKDLQKFQILYDKETKHSTDTAMQAKWNIKIAKMVKILEPHKDIQVTCTVY